MTEVGSTMGADALAISPEVDPLADLSVLFETSSASATGDSTAGSIESLTADIVMDLASMPTDQQTEVAVQFVELIDEVVGQLLAVDVNDPSSIAVAQSVFSDMMAVVSASGGSLTAETALLQGIADTSHAALGLANADAMMGGVAIDEVVAALDSIGLEFDTVISGQLDIELVSSVAIGSLITLFDSIQARSEEAGIPFASLANSSASVDTDTDVSQVDGLTSAESSEDATSDTGTGDEILDTMLAEAGIDTGETDSTGEDVASTISSGGLSSESSADGSSEANQAALEARFIGLYETLMEKQVSFKEAVEPYKTDNQNAGKG